MSYMQLSNQDQDQDQDQNQNQPLVSNYRDVHTSPKNPRERSFTAKSREKTDIEKDLCKMITLLQKVFDLLDAEPSPHILKEQTLYLIDIILKCCENYRYGN